jgi:hypothetical protein
LGSYSPVNKLSFSAAVAQSRRPMNRLSLAPVLRERRVWCLLLTSVVAVGLGFFAIPDYAAIVFVSKAGFWFVLVGFAIFMWALWGTLGSEIRAFRGRGIDWVSVAIIGLGTSVLLAHETYGFKIVMDEIMLLGTSMSMHLDKTVLTPLRGSDIQGAFVILDGLMDKRPLFFPFLVSLLHDLTGYRPANAFILNGGLTVVFLALVNLTGRLLAGRMAGWLAVALFAGLPLLAHNATGGGFELLNLVMILATMLLGARFVAKRDSAALTAFCFSALLLAQVRYESVIYILPVALIVLYVWKCEGRPILTWPVVIAPLLMVHYPLQHRIFDLRASAWEMASRPGYSTPFSPTYITENLSHTLNFFFARPSEQPNSLVLSVLGCVAIPFFALLVMKRIRRLEEERPAVVATTLFALGFAAQFALMMCYFWGKFDDPVIRRLSLPTHLGMVIAIVAVLPQITQVFARRLVFAVAVLGLVASGVPSMASHAYSQEYIPGRETAWRREFMAAQPRRDYLVIDNDSILWIVHQVSSTPMLQAMKYRDRIIWNMRNRTYSDIFVFQRYIIDAETGRMTLREGDDLGPQFVLETVREERLQTLTLSRLSRLKEVREGAVSLTAPDPTEHVVPKKRAEIEKIRREYLENFVKMLP